MTTTTLSLADWPARGRELFPGVLACAVAATAATFLSQHYGAPVMLFALLLGMAMNFLSTEVPCKPGSEFTSRHVLRGGVALLCHDRVAFRWRVAQQVGECSAHPSCDLW